MPFQTSTNQYQVSKYIVDPTAADSCYNTIQAALDAANTAGGNATIYVRNGTYTENLTLYSTLTIKGEIGVLGTAIGTVIVGVHTPPAAGNIVIEGVTLESATDVFNSAVAGTAAIYLERIIFEVTNGFIFNLVNWTGLLNINNAGENSTNNGILNNTGGATLFTNNCQIGAGVGQTMVANGDLRFDLTFIDCPCVFTGGGIISGNFIITGSTISIGGTKTGTIGMGSLIFGTLTTAGTATLAITDTTFETGAIQAITHGSGNQLSLADVTIDSTNNPCIGGAGAGNLLLGSVTYLNNSAIAGTVTKSFATRLETGELKIDDADNGVLHATTGVVTTLGAMVDGDLVIGSTGVNPAVGQLTAGAGVAIASGAGTITISATGSGLMGRSYSSNSSDGCSNCIWCKSSRWSNFYSSSNCSSRHCVGNSWYGWFMGISSECWSNSTYR